MTIPTVSQCIQLMDTYGMLDNIRHHSLVVARLAERLVAGLAASPAGLTAIPDRNLVIAGALLHDIAKTPCLDGSCDHSKEGAAICAGRGYQDVAAIVAEHVILRQYEPKRLRPGRFLAKEIVYYADKRVRHTSVVSLPERLEYILKHYGKGDAVKHRLITANFLRCEEFEQFLFSFLPFTPDALSTEEFNQQPQ